TVNVTGAPPEAVATTPVMSDGTLIVGGVESVMITLKDTGVAGLPAGSCALHVTGVVPLGNVDPDAGRQSIVISPAELSGSVGVTMYVTGAPSGPVAGAVWTPGDWMTGGVVSPKFTVTWNEPVVVWLDEFVAEQLTVVVPTGKVEPDAGAQFAVSGPSLKSEA